jgi:DNA primase
LGIRTSKDFVDAVRRAGDIVRLVSDYVPLRPAGSRLKGLCPFHQEKTPSFSVDPDLQLFYCFGCNTGGDLFKFVMLYEKVGFAEAVELLAQRWGVPVPAERSAESDVRSRLLELNREAEGFYRARLLDETSGLAARQYLGRREVSLEVATRLGLGYAPDAWEALRTHLLSRRFKPQELVEGGLTVSRKEGPGEYDRFRHRLMFPIRDVAGRTVAFGGRALGDSEPKYLNSPETPAYVKGDHLYGLDEGKEAIRREGHVVVVEGYLDLAALRQAGCQHSVASLGTAFTPSQARLLSRYTGRVVVCYDGDAAGAAATQRSLDLLLERGFEVRAAELPSGMDPDDFVRKEGAVAFEQLVQQAPGWLEYLVHRECATRDLRRTEEKVAAVNALLPRIARLASPVERASWAEVLSDALRIEDDLVLQELKTALRAARPAIRQRPAEREPLPEAQARLVRVLLHLGEARMTARGRLEAGDLAGTRVAPIVDAILRHGDEGKEVDLPTVLESLERDEDRDLLTWIAFREGPEISADEVEGCVRSLRRERLVKERRELQRAIERTADPAAVDALLLRKQQLGRQIDALN